METGGNEGGRTFVKRFSAIFICALIGACVAVLVLAVFAAAIVARGSFLELGTAGMVVAAAAAGFVSGFLWAKSAGRRGLLNGAAAAVLCAALLTLFSLLAGGKGGFAAPLICVAGGLAGGFSGVNLKRK